MVIDLLALSASPALHAFLARLLGSETLVKAGCGIRQDLAALARSYPCHSCLSAVQRPAGPAAGLRAACGRYRPPGELLRLIQFYAWQSHA